MAICNVVTYTVTNGRRSFTCKTELLRDKALTAGGAQRILQRQKRSAEVVSVESRKVESK